MICVWKDDPGNRLRRSGSLDEPFLRKLGLGVDAHRCPGDARRCPGDARRGFVEHPRRETASPTVSRHGRQQMLQS